MIIAKSLEDSVLLLKGVTGELFNMLLGTLGTSLLGDILLSKGVIRAGEGTAGVGC